jgi:pyruvyltransferase
MKTYFLHDDNHNAGDTLSKPILNFFGLYVKYVDRHVKGKLLAVGSVMSSLRRRDIVWGTGCIRNKKIIAPPETKFLAVRGPKTRALINNAIVPEIYGVPALLLPLIYHPVIIKRYKIGYVPHYADKEFFLQHHILLPSEKFIDIQKDWKEVINEILECETIVASSLHGIIFAEAYGIPSMWAKYSDNIIGGEFKFQDYFLGTGRPEQKLFTLIEPIKNLKSIQDALIHTLKTQFCL